MTDKNFINYENDENSEEQLAAEEIDPRLLELLSEQNFDAGLLAGIAAALVGALIWVVIAAITEHQAGWMAMGVGLLVGFSIRYFGNGIERIFGILGAILSLLGCLLGNFLVIVILVSYSEDVSILDLLTSNRFGTLFSIMFDSLQWFDLLFYGIAILSGYFLAIKSARLKMGYSE
ncbi:hypothetical protein JW964_00500 [candidate division KSB1 bacterium]|nr:hypothetical protein [candidate division KSB1 bacterium]